LVIGAAKALDIARRSVAAEIASAVEAIAWNIREGVGEELCIGLAFEANIPLSTR